MAAAEPSLPLHFYQTLQVILMPTKVWELQVSKGLGPSWAVLSPVNDCSDPGFTSEEDKLG